MKTSGCLHQRLIRMKGDRYWFCIDCRTQVYREHELKVAVCWCGSTHSWEKAKR